jgi:hypothetical protein
VGKCSRIYEARIGSIIARALQIEPMVDDLRLFWAMRDDLQHPQIILPVDDPSLQPKPKMTECTEPESPELAALRAALLSELDQIPRCNEKAEKVLDDLDAKLADVEQWLDEQVARLCGRFQSVQTKYAELAKANQEIEEATRGKLSRQEKRGMRAARKKAETTA